MSHNMFHDAFSIDVIGVAPRRVDVDAMTADLKALGDRQQQYVAVLAILASTVLSLTRSHQQCLTPRCQTCWELRHASAALTSLPFDHYSLRVLREAIR